MHESKLRVHKLDNICSSHSYNSVDQMPHLEKYPENGLDQFYGRWESQLHWKGAYSVNYKSSLCTMNTA